MRFLPLATQAALFGGLGPHFETAESELPDAPAPEAPPEGGGFLETIRAGAAELREEQAAKQAEAEAGAAELSAEERSLAAANRARTQERGEDGKFKPSEEKQAADAAAAAQASREQAAQAALEGEDAPAPEDAALEEAPTEEAEEAGEAEGAEPVVVKIPARRAGEDDEEWEIADPELAESINRLRNQAMRGEQYTAALTDLGAREEAVADLEAYIATDPIGYVVDGLPQEHRADVVRALLLADEELFNTVLNEATVWEGDETKRELARAQHQNRRTEVQRTATQARARQKQVSAAYNDILSSIHKAIPDAMDPDRTRRFYADAIRDVQEYLGRHPKAVINGQQAMKIIEQSGRTAMYGIKVPEGPASPASPPASPPAKAAGEERRSPAQGGDPLEKARGTGKKLAARAATRRTAAAVAPVGAGAAPGSRSAPPKGQGIKERIEWAEKNMR